MKNRLSLKAATGIAVTFCTLFFGVASANAAVSFVLKDGSNKAINVWIGSNAQYKFDGTQRAFVLQYNPNDKEQRFDQLPGNRGGYLYRVEGTNLCLNNRYNQNGAAINVWNCDANDSDQNWKPINLAGSIHLQNVTTGRCADSPSRDVAPNNLQVWDCIPGNRNQQFNVVAGATPAPTPAPTPPSGNLTFNSNSPLYRQNNPFWQSGYAPKSTNPPNPKLADAKGNCTWYANGRAKELGRNSSRVDKMSGMAYDWGKQALSAGLQTGKPQVGAIAQWDKTPTYLSGHVAVVEKVNSDGSIVISESSYSPVIGTTYDFLYRTRTISASDPTRFIIP
jgi:surface antigen